MLTLIDKFKKIFYFFHVHWEDCPWFFFFPECFHEASARIHMLFIFSLLSIFCGNSIETVSPVMVSLSALLPHLGMLFLSYQVAIRKVSSSPLGHSTKKFKCPGIGNPTISSSTAATFITAHRRLPLPWTSSYVNLKTYRKERH